MKTLFEELQKCGYTVHNKRVLGKPEHTSIETKQKDLIQEYALLGIWLLEKYGIWIWVEHYEKDTMFVPQIPKANLQKVLGYYSSPTEAYESAIEYILNKLI